MGVEKEEEFSPLFLGLLLLAPYVPKRGGFAHTLCQRVGQKIQKVLIFSDLPSLNEGVGKAGQASNSASCACCMAVPMHLHASCK